jgi:hypothetical protein
VSLLWPLGCWSPSSSSCPKADWRVLTMTKPLWQLLLEDPSDLTCDECFAIMEFYTDLLVQVGLDLFPEVLEHLERCPDCEARYRETLHRLMQAD